MLMVLGVDNQMAIRATNTFSSKVDYYLMDIFHDNLRSLILEDDERKLTVCWAPWHIEIEGNKVAD